MNQIFCLLFYSKKSKINSSGFVPIYLRITVDGSTEQVKLLNMYLKALEQKVRRFSFNLLIAFYKLALSIYNIPQILDNNF